MVHTTECQHEQTVGIDTLLYSPLAWERGRRHGTVLALCSLCDTTSVNNLEPVIHHSTGQLTTVPLVLR